MTKFMIFRSHYLSATAAALIGIAVSVLLPAEPLRADPPDKASSNKIPEPIAARSVVNGSHVIGWPAGKMPTAPTGFQVSLYSELDNPRWIYPLPNGDVLVSQTTSSAFGGGTTITLLRDTDGDGKPALKKTFLKDINKPFGMLLIGGTLYVGLTDGLVRYPYKTGDTSIDSKGEKILSLPPGGYNNHWTRNVVMRPDGRKLYVTVGSGSNVGENGMDSEQRRANILEINPDGTGERIFASGMRNPVGIDFSPVTGKLWTVVNERDALGDDSVPDYLTSVTDGGFYGWPYSYFGQNPDPRRQGERPDLIAKSLVPDLSLGSHTASLGLVFYRGDKFPAKYRQGAFIGQRGSWNRSQLAGYRVAFVPFGEDGKPSGPPEDFLTGFIADEAKSEVYGRPVGVTELKDGSLLVADEPGNKIWRVTAIRN